MRQNERNASRTRSPRGKSPSGRTSRCPCKDYLKGTCNNSFCEKWHPPECLFYKSENGCNFGKTALMHTARLMNSLAQGLKIMVTKVQWLCWKLHDKWVAYFKIWSRRSLQRFCGRAQTYWSQSDVFDSLKPCYVMLTFETEIHRLEWLAQVVLISVNPKLQNLRIGLKKRRNGKSDVPVKQRGGWTKNILKWKEKHKTAFFSPSEKWCPPASNLKPEERNFVVDYGPSMQKISTKDLNSAELETVTTSRSPTAVITANGEVQTHEDAAVYAKELDMFLTRTVLEDTPAVLSLGELCDEHGYSNEWISGHKTTSHQKRYSDTVQQGEHRTDRGSWFINEFFLKLAFFNVHDTFKAGNWSSQVFLKLVYFTNHNCVKRQWDESTGRSEWDRFLSRICFK